MGVAWKSGVVMKKPSRTLFPLPPLLQTPSYAPADGHEVIHQVQWGDYLQICQWPNDYLEQKSEKLQSEATGFPSPLERQDVLPLSTRETIHQQLRHHSGGKVHTATGSTQCNNHTHILLFANTRHSKDRPFSPSKHVTSCL